jgi:hypothetical protein
MPTDPRREGPVLKARNRPLSSGTGRPQTLCAVTRSRLRGILSDTGAPDGSAGPLSAREALLVRRDTGATLTEYDFQAHHQRTGAHSWRLRKAPKGRPRHARAILLRYRQRGCASWGQAVVSPPLLRSLRSSASIRLAGAKRAPCAFTETAVKRAIRAVRAAGETPGRLVVTREGFSVEFATDGAAGDPHIRPSTAAANTWDGLYDNEDEASSTPTPVP